VACYRDDKTHVQFQKGLFKDEQKLFLSEIFRRNDMSQFPNQNKLPLFMFKPLSDFNVIKNLKAETYASASVLSGLPVILLRKSSHIPYFLNYLLKRCFLIMKDKNNL
jgi:hypothetical protein